MRASGGGGGLGALTGLGAGGQSDDGGSIAGESSIAESIE